MEAALLSNFSCVSSSDLDESQCIERVRSFKKFAEEIRSGAVRHVQ